jgi:hypothetical protein
MSRAHALATTCSIQSRKTQKKMRRHQDSKSRPVDLRFLRQKMSQHRHCHVTSTSLSPSHTPPSIHTAALSAFASIVSTASSPAPDLSARAIASIGQHCQQRWHRQQMLTCVCFSLVICLSFLVEDELLVVRMLVARVELGVAAVREIDLVADRAECLKRRMSYLTCRSRMSRRARGR